MGRTKTMKNLALFLLAVTVAKPALAVIPQQGELVFDIYRNGKKFGSHVVSFEQNGPETTVQIDINMKYKLGPLTVFRYEHSNTEVWDGDEIRSLASKTYDDGKDYKVDAVWGDQLNVTVNGDSYEADPIYTTSYWNPVTLKDTQLLNTQKGEIEDVVVDFKGVEDFVVAGDAISAKRYSVDASVPLEVWYDQKTEQWVGLTFSVRGSDFEYRRVTPIQ